MDYKKIDPAATHANVVKALALDTERSAVAREIADAVDGTNTASDTRGKADRLRQHAKLKPKDVDESVRAFLDDRLAALEGEHASHAAKLAAKETLGLEPDDATFDGITIGQHRDAMEYLDKVHAEVTKRAAALGKPDPK